MTFIIILRNLRPSPFAPVGISRYAEDQPTDYPLHPL